MVEGLIPTILVSDRISYILLFLLEYERWSFFPTFIPTILILVSRNALCQIPTFVVKEGISIFLCNK